MKKSLYLLPVLMPSACGNKQADVGTSAKVEDTKYFTKRKQQRQRSFTKDNNYQRRTKESIRILEALLWLTDLGS